MSTCIQGERWIDLEGSEAGMYCLFWRCRLEVEKSHDNYLKLCILCLVLVYCPMLHGLKV